MGFRRFVRRYCRTYVNSLKYWLPGSPLSQYSSTASTYWTRAQPYDFWFWKVDFRGCKVDFWFFKVDFWGLKVDFFLVFEVLFSSLTIFWFSKLNHR